MTNDEFRAFIRFDEIPRDQLFATIMDMAKQIDSEFGRGDRLKMPELSDQQMEAFYNLKTEEEIAMIEKEQRAEYRRRMGI